MKNQIYPCLAIKGRIAEAADFYINTFGQGSVELSSTIVSQIELSGQKFMLLNEGPSSSPNPSVSFMVMCKSTEEAENYWKKLIDEGTELMPLDSYDWSPKYGWLQDKFGISWQIYTGNEGKTAQKFCPTFMFSGNKAGKAENAIHFYTELFPDSSVEGILRHDDDDKKNAGLVKHAQFKINDFVIMAMDSREDIAFDFNDAISMVVACDTQDEIDNYWLKLTADGGTEVACGWLTDKYGISWQVIPAKIGEWISDPQRAQRIMPQVMKMKKLVIAELENA